MRRPAVVLGMVGAMLVVPAPVLAHGMVGRLESPLPLAVYLGGAAMAVALSFAFLIARDVAAPAGEHRRVVRIPGWLRGGLRSIGMIGWLWIVAQTIIGGSSDADVATLFLWVYGWVGVAALSALVGPVWTWLDPFSTLFDLGSAVVRRMGVQGWEPAPYPARLGAWPAVAGLAVVVWLELAYRGGGLGVILLGYTLLTLAAMANFGRDAWRTHGEIFSVWFGTLNRLAPFGRADRSAGTVERRPFGIGLLDGGWTRAHAVIVAIGVGSILYDGLSQTQTWFDWFGVPSLPAATVLLFAFLGLVAGIALLVARLVGLAAVAAGMVPIAVGYLIAHYLTYVLGDGQRIVVAVSDPLQLGWDLFGTAFYEPGTDWIPPVALWTIMLSAVVGGHVLGAWSGHVVAVRDAPPGSRARVRQLPLAALMVALTVTTLWSLGQAVVKEPEMAAEIARAVADAGEGPAQTTPARAPGRAP